DDNLVTLHHSDKFRGPGFEPITFKLEKITTNNLVDSKGRLTPTVHAIAITGQEEEEQAASAEHDEDELLTALENKKALSIADLARACGWLLTNGEPHKSKVDRVMTRLLATKLVKRVRGRHYKLTEEGKNILNQTNDKDEVIENRSGATSSSKPFHALWGAKQRPTIPCAY